MSSPPPLSDAPFGPKNVSLKPTREVGVPVDPLIAIAPDEAIGGQEYIT
jgi:hypothetical protein